MELHSALHQRVLDGIISRGFPPAAEEIAADLEESPERIRAGLTELHDEHGLVLSPGSYEIWCAHPFSLVPTAIWVETHARGWWAPCPWCALGILALTGDHGSIHTRLGGESRPVEVRCRPSGMEPDDLLVHFPISAARAWDNVHRFCASSLLFRTSGEVDQWCERHGVERGDVRPLADVRRLAWRWYGDYLSPGWHKWSVAEARAIFDECGFTGPTWELPLEETGRY